MEKGSTTINGTLLVGVLALVVGIGVGYGLSFGGDTPQAGKHMMPDGTVMHDETMSGDMDRRFIEEMIPHHEGAIAMAQIALERSKRAEMLNLAKGIIQAQEKEIADMRGWYLAWYKTEVPKGAMSGMHMGGMTGEPDVLRTVPQADFDREFIEQMIPHHEMAVMMAQMLSSATQRSEMKQLGENIVTSQTNEIQMMRGWLKSWY